MPESSSRSRETPPSSGMRIRRTLVDWNSPSGCEFVARRAGTPEFWLEGSVGRASAGFGSPFAGEGGSGGPGVGRRKFRGPLKPAARVGKRGGGEEGRSPRVPGALKKKK